MPAQNEGYCLNPLSVQICTDILIPGGGELQTIDELPRLPITVLNVMGLDVVVCVGLGFYRF